MRAVVQRVSKASVKVDGNITGKIGKGLLVFLAVCDEDTNEDLVYLADKIMGLRIFEDENEKMNLSLKDVGGELLVVSQFTLYGDCRKGRRPNFMQAQSGEQANKLYEEFIELIKTSNLKVESGEFGADMKVQINNDGPVTILLDSKKTF